MLIIIIFECICGVLLRTSVGMMDLKYMIKMAYNIAHEMEVPQYSIDYYIRYPNNDFTIYVLIYVYKIFGIFGIEGMIVPGIILNILMITLSIIVFYFVIRKLYGNKVALTLLGIIPILTPIFTYIPVFYTDTLSMFFVVMCYYLYLIYKDKNNTKSKIMYIIMISIIAIIAIIGIKIKPTVAIIVISIYIDMLLNNKKFISSLKFIIISITVIFIGNMLMNSIMNNSGYFNVDVSKKHLPYTHWIFMGLSKQYKSMNDPIYGVWCPDDVIYTMDAKVITYNDGVSNIEPSKLKYEEMNERCCKGIKERLQKMGIKGTLEFEYKKLIQTWGDGTYFAPIKITEYAVIKNSILGDFFHYDGKNFKIYYYFSHGVQVIMLFNILISTILNIKKENNTNVLRIAIFGLIILLEVWETRSRYVLNYILIMFILGIPAIEYISTKFICIINKMFCNKNSDY